MSTVFIYEPIKGYSVPVVRISNGGAVATLSFTLRGKPINPPTEIPQGVLKTAWAVWKAAQ